MADCVFELPLDPGFAGVTVGLQRTTPRWRSAAMSSGV